MICCDTLGDNGSLIRSKWSNKALKLSDHPGARSLRQRYILKGIQVCEEQAFSAVGQYFGKLNKLMDESEDSKKIAHLVADKLGSNYSMAIMRSLTEIDNLHKEICQVLDDFGGRQAGFFKYLTVDHLILLIKFYVVQWSTLTDMMASLINTTFNLGIADKDISFGLVIRNQHVQHSDIIDILKSHSKDIEYDLFNKHRNEIVHRGKILDNDVLDLKIEWNRLYSKKYSFFVGTPISDDEYKAESASLNAKTSEIAASKQSYYRNHYQKTLKAVAEMIVAMACKTILLYEKDAI